jgi:hypothetical protein
MDFFNGMGKPLSPQVRQEGYDHCKTMGLDSANAWSCVGAVAEQLERDKPYEAQGAGMRFLDLTGTYRLMAVLLAAQQSTEGESNA